MLMTLHGNFTEVDITRIATSTPTSLLFKIWTKTRLFCQPNRMLDKTRDDPWRKCPTSMSLPPIFLSSPFWAQWWQQWEFFGLISARTRDNIWVFCQMRSATFYTFNLTSFLRSKSNWKFFCLNHRLHWDSEKQKISLHW
jgi:hypothetical protein